MNGRSSCSVLLCTYNGAAFLEQQFQSLADQSVDVLDIYVSDDGSVDQTLEIVERWKRQWTKGVFVVEKGPCRGFAENFRSLVLRAPQSDFYAFCDQDDRWHPDKLESAIRQLAPSAQRPALYGGRTILVDESGDAFGMTSLISRPPSFCNALIQNIAGGNTMVFNRPGFALLAESARRTGFLIHDWWAYLILTGAGGQFIYDPVPHIDYRQHPGNAIGARITLGRRVWRIVEMLQGKYVAVNDANIRSLERCSELLTADALAQLATFRAMRQSWGVKAVHRLMRGGFHRHTIKGNISLAVAAFLRRL